MGDDPAQKPSPVWAQEARQLRALWDEKKGDYTQESFGDAFEIGSQGMVWQYLHGHRPLNLTAARRFAKGLGVEIAAFSPRLQREAELVARQVREDGPPRSGEAPTSLVPVVGTARGGEDGYYVEIEYPTGAGDGYVRYPIRHQNTYALRVKGDSMRPRIQPGEYVIVEPDSIPAPGDEVIVKTRQGRTMVKRLASRRGGQVELLSINDNHKPLTIETTDIEFIHVVAGIAKPSLFNE
jgi:phage repressor protein C with HTH and peptisase S24 domain